MHNPAKTYDPVHRGVWQTPRSPPSPWTKYRRARPPSMAWNCGTRDLVRCRWERTSSTSIPQRCYKIPVMEDLHFTSMNGYRKNARDKQLHAARLGSYRRYRDVIARVSFGVWYHCAKETPSQDIAKKILHVAAVRNRIFVMIGATKTTFSRKSNTLRCMLHHVAKVGEGWGGVELIQI